MALWLAADALVDGTPELTLVGEEAALQPFLHFVDGRYLPTVAVHRLLRGAPVPEVAKEVLSGRKADGQATAYLCRHATCQAPVHTVEALEVLLATPSPVASSTPSPASQQPRSHSPSH